MSGQGSVMAADEVLQQMRDCGIEVNDAKRLACYDAAIGRTETSADVGLTGKLPRSKRQGAGRPDATPKSVRSKVVAVTRPPAGKFVVTLDNGQVWSQQELIDFPIEVGDEVTIRSGLLGALWLSDGHRNQETRVGRTR
jgi:hypothetical protein